MTTEEWYKQLIRLVRYSPDNIMRDDFTRTLAGGESKLPSLIDNAAAYRRFRSRLVAGNGMLKSLVMARQFTDARDVVQALVSDLTTISDEAHPRGTVELEGVRAWGAQLVELLVKRSSST